jgi:hypothetical protein
VQAEVAARAALGSGAQFTYLDAARAPQGPVSRAELDALYRSGVIAAETDMLESGSNSGKKYSSLLDARV